MNQKSKDFIIELAALFEKYEVTLEVEESCSGWDCSSYDQLSFEIPYVDDDYKFRDYINIRGKYLEAKDFREALND